MQSKFSVSLTSCDQFKTIAIIDVITKLDKLNQVKSTILGTINNKISERITRLLSIKSRLLRLKEMIKIVSNQSKTITIKSKTNYPKNKYIIPNAVLSSEENDVNILRNIQTMDINDKINTQCVFADPDSNSVENLEKTTYLKEAPSGSIEEALAMQILINESLDKYKEISRTIFEERFKKGGFNKEGEFEIDQNDKNSVFTLTNFSFINKKKINAHIKRMVEGDFVKLAETEAMIAFNKRMKEREKNKNIQEAPVSILTNQKLGEYSDKVVFNLNKNEQNFDLDLPDTLNLGNVAVIDRDSEVPENTSVEINNEEDQLAQKEIDELFNKEEGMELPEEDEPLDWMKEKKIRNQNAINENINNQNEQNEQTNANNNQSSNTQQPSQPSAPSSSTTNVSCSVKAVAGSGPGIPPPPPVPIPVAKPKQAKVEPPKQTKAEPPKQEQETQKEEPPKQEAPQQELSREDELAMAMNTLKKVGEVKVEETAPKTLSMEEQINLARNKLKKVGDS